MICKVNSYNNCHTVFGNVVEFSIALMLCYDVMVLKLHYLQHNVLTMYMWL